jgi:hypothetical protein
MILGRVAINRKDDVYVSGQEPYEEFRTYSGGLSPALPSWRKVLNSSHHPKANPMLKMAARISVFECVVSSTNWTARTSSTWSCL